MLWIPFFTFPYLDIAVLIASKSSKANIKSVIYKLFSCCYYCNKILLFDGTLICVYCRFGFILWGSHVLEILNSPFDFKLVWFHCFYYNPPKPWLKLIKVLWSFISFFYFNPFYGVRTLQIEFSCVFFFFFGRGYCHLWMLYFIGHQKLKKKQ